MMIRYFIDTFYLVALSNRRDNYHSRAVSFSRSLTNYPLYTVDEVLIEFLNYSCELGSEGRQRAINVVRALLNNPQVTVIVASRDSFLAAMAFYEKRLDKGYSLTDCVSMLTMQHHQITQVLSNDHHFRQAGFTPVFAE